MLANGWGQQATSTRPESLQAPEPRGDNALAEYIALRQTAASNIVNDLVERCLDDPPAPRCDRSTVGTTASVASRARTLSAKRFRERSARKP